MTAAALLLAMVATQPVPREAPVAVRVEALDAVRHAGRAVQVRGRLSEHCSVEVCVLVPSDDPRNDGRRGWHIESHQPASTYLLDAAGRDVILAAVVHAEPGCFDPGVVCTGSPTWLQPLRLLRLLPDAVSVPR